MKSEARPYVLVRDVLAGWDRYERLGAELGDPIPEGLLLHAAGPTEVGFRTIEVWESERAWHCFRNRLTGLFDDLPVPPLVRELRVWDLVSRPAAAGAHEVTSLEQKIDALHRLVAAARQVA